MRGGEAAALTTQGESMPEYVDQSASGLRFYLVKGAVDVEQYTVLKRAMFDWQNYQVEMGILGASHFFRITFDDGQILNEIFACAEITTSLPLISSGPLGSLRSQVMCDLNGLTYCFSPKILDWDDGTKELQQLIDAVAAQKPTTHGVMFEFPSAPESHRVPLTLIHAEVRDSLTIQTVHCYPNEGRMVFTCTTLERK